jgi:tetratricopeptide (TPR) repeat protein
MGAHDQAITTGHRALALATANGEVALQVQANLRLGGVYLVQGDYQRAIDYLRQTVALLEGALRYERFGLLVLPAVSACGALAGCHAALGTFAEGRALGDEGLRIAEAVDHPGSLMFASLGSGALALRQGNLGRALPLLERAMGICQDIDISLWFPSVATTLGLAYALTGRIADAMPLLTQALERTMAMEMVLDQTFCRLNLGHAHMLAGRLEEAHAFAECALETACKYQERGHQVHALRLLGEIAAHRDPPDVDAAAAHYRQALALAEELGMRPLQAHCHRGLGTLYAATGQREQARAELSMAITMYQAMEMTFWLPQAEAALAQVDA